MPHSDRVDVELEASVPTPVLDLRSSGLDFGPGNLLVKNDGLSGLTYGGNKTRKLAPVFRALRARGIRRVLTTGTAGSHHVLAMGLFGPAEHLRVTALLFPQVHTPHTVTVLRAISTLELEILPCPTARAALGHASRWFDRDSAWVGPGALGATSAKGYVTAFAEWNAQRSPFDLRPETFEHHVVAAGSGGTAAGLLAGLCATRRPGRVVAVAVNHNPTLRSLIVTQALGVCERPTVRKVIDRHRLCVTEEALGRGYGYPSTDTHRAIEHASQVGLTLDHAYTAKAFSIAVRVARAHPKDAVVFWHTLSQRSLEPWLAKAPPLSHLDPAVRQLVIF